jgi:hypothetical protein
VITIYRIEGDHALVGDLTDAPISIGLPELAEARDRIKKQKNRLLWIVPGSSLPDLRSLVRAGLRTCHQGMTKQRMANFRLDALRIWGDRLHDSRDKESWERLFVGSRLWSGLTMAHDFIENYGTGGGLCRPLFAEFLAESAAALKDSGLRALSEKYAELGKQWSELAYACLPENVAECQEARRLFVQRHEASSAGGPSKAIAACWEGVAALAKRIQEKFPFSPEAARDLRAALQKRVRALYDGEVKALGELATWAA